jgi:hypothetical protein
MRAPRIVVDRSRFPLVIQSMFADFGEADVDHMFAEYEELLRRAEPYVIIVDLHPKATIPGAAERQRIARWWLPRRELVNALNVCTVTVMPSELMRGALTAILWLVQPSNPYKVAANMRDGVELAIGVLREAGLPVTPAIEALRQEHARA